MKLQQETGTEKRGKLLQQTKEGNVTDRGCTKQGFWHSLIKGASYQCSAVSERRDPLPNYLEVVRSRDFSARTIVFVLFMERIWYEEGGGFVLDIA